MIRQATINDISELLTLEQSAFGADAFKKSQLARLLSSNTTDIFVYEENNKLAASIIVLHRIKCKNDRVYSLTVSQEFRGRGLAQQLITHVESIAKSKGKIALTLEVRPDNTTAIGLYQKLGFTKTGELPSYYHDKSPAIHMIKML